MTQGHGWLLGCDACPLPLERSQRYRGSNRTSPLSPTQSQDRDYCFWCSRYRKRQRCVGHELECSAGRVTARARSELASHVVVWVGEVATADSVPPNARRKSRVE